MQHLLFSRRQQRPSITIRNIGRFRSGHGGHQVTELLVTGPDLSRMDTPNTLAQHLESQILAADNSLHTRPEQRDHLAIPRSLANHNNFSVFMPLWKNI